MEKLRRQTKKIIVGVVGAVVLIGGIVMIPYPGPGWLVVFAGLTILSTEFSWAERLLHYAKSKYDTWADWVAKQNIYIRLALMAVTGIVVVITLWLVNAYGLINDWLSLDRDWLRSPLFK